MFLHVLIFNEMGDYRKVLLYCCRVNGYFGLFCDFIFALFGMTKLLVAKYWSTPNVEKCDFN